MADETDVWEDFVWQVCEGNVRIDLSAATGNDLPSNSQAASGGFMWRINGPLDGLLQPHHAAEMVAVIPESFMVYAPTDAGESQAPGDFTLDAELTFPDRKPVFHPQGEIADGEWKANDEYAIVGDLDGEADSFLKTGAYTEIHQGYPRPHFMKIVGNQAFNDTVNGTGGGGQGMAHNSEGIRWLRQQFGRGPIVPYDESIAAAYRLYWDEVTDIMLEAHCRYTLIWDVFEQDEPSYRDTTQRFADD